MIVSSELSGSFYATCNVPFEGWTSKDIFNGRTGYKIELAEIGFCVSLIVQCANERSLAPGRAK